MKKSILLIVAFIALATVANAQTFTSDAVITITRKSDGASPTQNKADQALVRDIERYVIAHAGGVVRPTEKNAGGTCLPFTTTIGNRTINVDVYNRDASTCAPLILGNGKTDLRTDNAMRTILNRLFNAQFNHITDANYVQDAATVAAKTAETTATNDPARTAEKVDPPQ